MWENELRWFGNVMVRYESKAVREVMQPTVAWKRGRGKP